MKRRLFTLLLACLMVCTCIVPAAAYTPQVRDIDPNDHSGISMTPVMSYNELLDYMVEVKHFSREEALQLIPKTRASDGNKVLSVTLSVENKPLYKPTLDFYCHVSVGDGVWGIQDIYLVQMDRSSGGITKQFSGEVNVWLRGPERIEYVVNGDFYNYGTTTVSAGGKVQIGIGNVATLEFSATVTTTDNWYAYCYNNAIKRFT